MSGWRGTAARSRGDPRASATRSAKVAKPLMALAVVVGIAILREGSEVVLFLYGVVIASHDSGGAFFSAACWVFFLASASAF